MTVNPEYMLNTSVGHNPYHYVIHRSHEKVIRNADYHHFLVSSILVNNNIQSHLLMDTAQARIDAQQDANPFIPHMFFRVTDETNYNVDRDYYAIWMLFDELYERVQKTLRAHLVASITNRVEFADIYPEDIQHITNNQNFVMLRTNHALDLIETGSGTTEIRESHLARFNPSRGVRFVASPISTKPGRAMLTCIGDASFDYRLRGQEDWQTTTDQFEIVVAQNAFEYDVRITPTD